MSRGWDYRGRRWQLARVRPNSGKIQLNLTLSKIELNRFSGNIRLFYISLVLQMKNPGNTIFRIDNAIIDNALPIGDSHDNYNVEVLPTLALP